MYTDVKLILQMQSTVLSKCWYIGKMNRLVIIVQFLMYILVRYLLYHSLLSSFGHSPFVFDELLLFNLIDIKKIFFLQSIWHVS